MTQNNHPILKITGLTTYYHGYFEGVMRTVKAVDNVSFSVDYGETLAIIGESGCGKTTLGLSILRVLPPSAQIVSGSILFDGEEILEKTQREMTDIRGEKMSMILQDPMVSLNPVFTVGNQIGEALRFHHGLRGERLIKRIKELITSVQIPEPEKRINQWPHEMSGGMRQRIVGAIALSCEPKLIFADEPTTNLDVTIQLQYLQLLKELKDRSDVTLIFITHNLGIVAQMCESVVVMYAGKIVERAPVMAIYEDPAHPYTKGLLGSAFGLRDLTERPPIPGEPPNLAALPGGCSFHPRCKDADQICREKEPPEISLGSGRFVKCWLHVDT